MRDAEKGDFAFSPAELRQLAKQHLYQSPPREADDFQLPPQRSDDDLNRHLGETFDVGDAPRAAAVLVGLVAKADALSMLLTTRTSHLASHGGQVAFPGGKIDAGDAGPLAAALREANEETGLDPAQVEPLGYLDVYQTRTNYRIVPVVALLNPPLKLRPEPGEVADIFEVPLQFLMTPDNHQTHSREWLGKMRYFYAMPYHERYIWGVTAGMIRNLYDRLYRR